MKFSGFFLLNLLEKYTCDVMAKELNCVVEESEFEVQLHYYVHFRTNTLWKGMNLLTSPQL